MTLAIIAPSFDHLSETFIADHVRTLAPGRTVLISQDGRGSAGLRRPGARDVQPAFTAFGPGTRGSRSCASGSAAASARP